MPERRSLRLCSNRWKRRESNPLVPSVGVLTEISGFPRQDRSPQLPTTWPFSDQDAGPNAPHKRAHVFGQAPSLSGNDPAIPIFYIQHLSSVKTKIDIGYRT